MRERTGHSGPGGCAPAVTATQSTVPWHSARSTSRGGGARWLGVVLLALGCGSDPTGTADGARAPGRRDAAATTVEDASLDPERAEAGTRSDAATRSDASRPSDARREDAARGDARVSDGPRSDAGARPDARRPDASRPPDGARSCPASLADCDGVAGCETDILTDEFNCGACGSYCQGLCIQGRCECALDQMQCGGRCVSTSYDTANCGACGNACPRSVANGSPECRTGQCVAYCFSHYGNCDGALANGCETDLRSNDGHCGQCGDACAAGATCQGGMCIPRPRPTVVTLTQGSPVDVVVDATSVYWATRAGDLYAMPLQGGQPRVLANGFAKRLAVDSTSLYWIEGPDPSSFGGQNGAINKLPIAGGSVTLLASTPAPVAIALDPSAVYWTNAGGVVRVGLDGGAQTVVAGVADAGALALDATFVYFVGGRGQNVLKVPKAGGLPSTLSSGASVSDLAVDASNVYLGGFSGITVLALAGGPPRSLQLRDVTQLVSDGTFLYAMTTDSFDALSLQRIPITGGTGTTLAAFDYAGGVADRMALGARDVFVADYQGYAIVRTMR